MGCEIDNCVELCGNGVCDESEGENSDTCPKDCNCNLDGICDSWETIKSCSLDCTCGNRQCDYDLGESVANCMSDCACNANYDCEPWEDEKIVLEIAVFQHCMVMVTVMMATMDMMARINNSTEVMDMTKVMVMDMMI